MTTSKDEYEIQHYSFSLDQMKNDTKELVLHQMHNKFNIVCTVLEKNITDEAAKEMLKQKKEQIMGKMQNTIEKQFDKFNGDIDKNLAIPQYILLPENIIHDVRKPQYTEADVKELTRQFEEKKIMFKENIGVIMEMHKVTEAFAQLEPALDNEAVLHDTLGEALEQGVKTNLVKNKLKDISEIIQIMKKK